MPTSAPKEDRRMAYREVGMMDIDQVIRRWLAGEKIRAIARLTGTDRNTVRRAESPPGEMAEADFGRLGALQELGSCQPRMVQGFIVTLGYSRLSCVIPAFKQDLPTVIDCFERAWVFFGGCPRRVVIDGMK